MSKRKGSRKSPASRRNQVGKTQTGVTANLRYKDTVFRMLFREKKRLLGLYNAIGGKNYTDPEKLNVVTLENAVYMGMKNDLAFLIDLNLYLFEHQSSVNKNMPLRFLQYVTTEYGKLTASDNLYGEKLIKIPAPHFVVFYNGIKAYPEKQELKLSAAYQIQEAEPELELQALVFNINEGFNENLIEQCRTLAEYMQYVDKVRAHAKDMPIDEAVDKAVDECIEQDILREFLLRNRAEVKRMSIFEYDEEATRKAIRDNAYERGVEDGYERGVTSGETRGENKGRVNSILQLLEEIEPISSALKEEILAETNEEVLKKWLSIAAHAENIDEFIKEKSKQWKNK